jgi:hypothetical protein
MSRKKPAGWKGESERHRKAALGISTGRRSESWSPRKHYKKDVYVPRPGVDETLEYRGNKVEYDEDEGKYWLVEDDGHRVLLVEFNPYEPHPHEPGPQYRRALKKIDQLMDEPEKSPYLEEDLSQDYFYMDVEKSYPVSESPKTKPWREHKDRREAKMREL